MYDIPSLGKPCFSPMNQSYGQSMLFQHRWGLRCLGWQGWQQLAVNENNIPYVYLLFLKAAHN